MNLLRDIIFVLTDSVHRQGFKLQAKILGILFEILTTDYVKFYYDLILRLPAQ